MTEERKLDANVLAKFAGSEVLYRHSLLPRVRYTEGVKYVAEEAGAYWLIDEVAFAQRYEAGVAAEAFQLWSLSVTGNTGAGQDCCRLFVTRFADFHQLS